ncbi:MAG TPA: ATP-binding protein [Chiayiivirga sp.]|nr:ATP-binding protein [Chiayiivirga sp.]
MRWNAGFVRGWNMQAPAEKAADSAGHCRGLPPAARVIATSQLPLKQWHAQFQDPPLADAILDRLVHNAEVVEMTGESLHFAVESAAAWQALRRTKVDTGTPATSAARRSEFRCWGVIRNVMRMPSGRASFFSCIGIP